MKLPWVSRALYEQAIEARDAADLRADQEHMRAVRLIAEADMRADRVTRSTQQLIDSILEASGRTTEAARAALKEAGEIVRAAAQATVGPPIPDELPEPDTIARNDKRRTDALHPTGA